MKASARKIKDNEWIAEVEITKKMSVSGQHHWIKYPIVSPSDKEWLEKNNMNGKEVDGELRINIKSNIIDKYIFQLATPPIHSEAKDDNPDWSGYGYANIHDPAGENIVELGKHLSALKEFGLTKKQRYAIVSYMREQSTPQTGVTELDIHSTKGKQQWLKAFYKRYPPQDPVDIDSMEVEGPYGLNALFREWYHHCAEHKIKTPQTNREKELEDRIQTMSNMINEERALWKKDADELYELKQQTGRTYTEGEVQAIRDEYIEREKMICRKAQEDYNSLEAVKNSYKKELCDLKQTPKP